MKKITFLLSLVFAFFWGGITASAQVDEFQTSEAPSSGEWAPNTTWYKMSLRAKYVTLKSATKPFNLLLACTCPLVTEFADN